jgi:hypothetical protein
MKFSFLPIGTIKRSYQEEFTLASGPLRLTMGKAKIEALNDDGDPLRGDREVGIALIELGAIKKGKKARGHEWPARPDSNRGPSA